LLLTQDDNGEVWRSGRFRVDAKRHNISDRAAQFKMATMVVESITSTIRTSDSLDRPRVKPGRVSDAASITS